MERVKIGNDILIRWSLFDESGYPLSISAEDIMISATTRAIKQRLDGVSLRVEEGMIYATFAGSAQIYQGKYALTLRIRNDRGQIFTVDACDVFELVANGCCEEVRQGEIVVIDLESQISSEATYIPAGPSDNEIWLKTSRNKPYSDYPWAYANGNRLNIIGVVRRGDYFCFIYDGIVEEVGNFTGSPSEPLEVIFPSSLRIIRTSSLSSKPNLTKVVAPAITSIYEDAFADTPALREAPSAIIINDRAFQRSGIQRYDFSRTTLFRGDAFIESSLQEALAVNGKAISSASDLFSNCAALKRVELIGDSDIPAGFCSGATALEEVSIIGGNITLIGGVAFRDCKKLNIIDLSGTSIIEYSSFKGCVSLETANLSSVEWINEHAFEGCYNLKNLTLSHALYSLGTEVFSGCSRLEVIDLGNCESLEEINTGAFNDCGGSTVILPPSVVYIGNRSFQRCNLTKIDIPSTCTRIGNNAFNGCANLREIICRATVPPTIYEQSFKGSSGYRVYVPAGSVSAYKSAEFWSNFEILAL